jgi:YesN/AraC family two-component response regulator
MVGKPGDLYSTLDKRLAGQASDRLIEQGLDYFKRDVPDSALECFAIVANRRHTAAPNDTAQMKFSARALKDMGNIYKDYYPDYLEASKCYQACMDIAQKYHFDDMRAMAINGLTSLEISNAYLYQETPHIEDTILTRYSHALDIAIASGLDDEQLAIIANNIAICAYSYNKAQEFQPVMEKFLRDKGDHTSQPIVLAKRLCQAVIAHARGDSEMAVELLDQALEQATVGRDIVRLNTIKFFILGEMGKDEEAVATYKKVEQYASGHDRHILMADVYHNLMVFYRSRGNDQEADKYEQLALKEQNLILSKGRLIDMNEQKFLLRIDEANKQAERLAYQNRIKARILWVITAFVLLLVASWLLIYRKYRQVKEKNRLLYQRSLDVLQAEQDKLDVIEQQQERRSNTPLNDEQQSELLHRVFIVMETCPEVYQENFTLGRLAELTGAVRNYVSQVINDRYNCSFNNLLAEYRVKEACRRMHDKSYNNYTLEALGASVGIKSRSNFVVHFRRVTGMTPSAYWRMARNDEAPQQPE